MKYFDLHADVAYRCLKENLAFDDVALNVTAQKAAAFDEWHQCFPVFINDGTDKPFEYYKKAVAFLKNEFKTKAQNLTPILTVEGGLLVEDALNRIEIMHNDGIRATTLTYNAANQIAGGAFSDGDFNVVGKDVIKELNRYGIMLDLAHINKKSYYPALELADRPLITHTCFEYVNKHCRNVDDDQIKALVDKKGIFGLCYYPLFLGEGDTLENIYKSVYHILELGFEDYLSMGSDFDGCDLDERLSDISQVPSLYEYLNSRNINKEILDKIFFYNAYNFFNNKGEL